MGKVIILDSDERERRQLRKKWNNLSFAEFSRLTVLEMAKIFGLKADDLTKDRRI